MSSGAALSQEEILSSVKTVSQGLEALKSEHQQILVGLASSVDSIKKESGDASFVEQKAQIIMKSVESLELGIGEAQVGSSTCGLLLLLLGMLIPGYVESRDPNRQSRVPTGTRKGRNRRTYGE